VSKKDSKAANQMADSQHARGAAVQDQAMSGVEKGVSDFRTTVHGVIDKNPYLDPAYLSRQRLLASDALGANENAVQDTLNNYSLRSGTNSANIAATGKELARQRGRDLTDYMAGTANKDYAAYQDMRTKGAGMLGEVPGMYTPMMGAGTGLQTNAMDARASVAKQPGFWSQFGQDLAQGAGAAAGAYAGGCWIAEALYGENDPRTHLLRSWLNDEFKRTMLGRVVMAFYLRYGQRIAAIAKRSRMLRAVLRPLFELALKHARRDRMTCLLGRRLRWA